MANNLKYVVGQLNKGNHLEECIPEYAKEAAHAYHRYAKVRLMMEYYMSYEVEAEGLNAYADMVKEDFLVVHDVIGGMYRKDASPEKKAEWIERLLAGRDNTIAKMQVLTAYVDTFILYEYVFNRLQYRFEEIPEEVNDEELTKRIVQFIFSTKDNVIINENIHTMLGQLPVRMAKGRYYDIVKNSLSMYKGADRQSLDSYLYMFRTSAMLYKPDGMEEYFTEFRAVADELSDLDYAGLTKEQYQLYADKIAVMAQKLKDISDLYMSLQQIVNSLLAVLYAEGITENGWLPKEEVADRVIRGIHALYTGAECPVWEEAGEELATEEEKLAWLSEEFCHIEGVQEEDQESLGLIEAILHETIASYKEEIEKLGYGEAYAAICRLEQLASASIFIEFVEEEVQDTVDEACIEEVTASLLQELEQLFTQKGRYIKRAVMAATLEKMPVFFDSAQEVADYVGNVLSQCSDGAEKYAVATIMEELMA